MLFCFGLILPFIGQSQMIFDTLDLVVVEIMSQKIEKTAGFTVVQVDSSTRADYLTQNLAELISSTTPVFVKSYGQGSLATTSFRGVSATHTQVLWNGVNINSPMPGQSDFSQIPVYFVDQVKLYFGAASIFQTSGGLGGSISIENKVPWNNLLNIELLQEAASFETYRTFAGVKVGNSRFQSSTRVLFASAENNFEFLNIAVSRENPPVQFRKDASFLQNGILQELALKAGKRGILSAKIWAQENHREIPPNILVNAPEGNENLTENFMRGLISFDYFAGQSVISAQSGILYNFLNYQNKTSLTDADNTVVSSVNSIKSENQISDKLFINAGLNFSHHQVNSENYIENKIRDEGSLSAGLNYHVNDRVFLNLLVRQEIIDGRLTPATPSFGIKYKILKAEDFTFKFNFARNFHAPTLNDLYWFPGGNANLQNETGYSSETGFIWKKQIENLCFETSLTGFYSDIQNWIMWQPDSVNSFWTPLNLKNVISTGIEAGVKVSLKTGKANWSYTFGYAFTSAENKKPLSENDQADGKQLIYVPKNTVNQNLKLSYKNFSLGYSMNYTGKRFTTSDNSRYMPAFTLHDLRFGKLVFIGKSVFEVNFSIFNLTGKNYQVIAWQPMPGRNYSFSVRYNFGK